MLRFRQPIQFSQKLTLEQARLRQTESHERLADVWARPQFRALRRELLRGDFRKPICRACVGLEEREPLAVNPPRAAR